MLRFLGTGPSAIAACDGIPRREMLRIGGLGALGLTLPHWLSAREQPSTRTKAKPKAKACILIYLFGGPSQIDTFDPKPDAPEQFRGEFGTIETQVPGLRFCEHLPLLATMADRFRVIRSMTHEHPRHGWGLYYMMTGRRHSRPDLDAPPTPDDFPGLGAMVTRLGPNQPGIPPAVTLPRWNRFLDLPNDYAGEKAGFLGSSFNPWLIQAQPKDNQSFRLSSLDLPINVPVARLSERRELLKSIENQIDAFGEAGQTHDALHSRAAAILASSNVREAFRLEKESDDLRDRYGRHPFGQGLLLARRLIEAGTTLVQVNWHNDGSDVKSPFWDTHKDNFRSLKERLLPPFDLAFSALLEDLRRTGLDDDTLVLVMGEFGRTPRVGQTIMNAATDSQGRDHWPHAYSILAAGCGIPGGAYGATDNRAAYVIDRPISPPDLIATTLNALGISPKNTLLDRRGQSHPASLGQMIPDLF